jgi:hypothetical protein
MFKALDSIPRTKKEGRKEGERETERERQRERERERERERDREREREREREKLIWAWLGDWGYFKAVCFAVDGMLGCYHDMGN